MLEPRDRDLWKQAAMFLAGVVLTALTALFTISGKSVSAEQVSEAIQKESPYVQDRELMRDVHRRLLGIDDRLLGLEREVSAMKGMIRTNGEP